MKRVVAWLSAPQPLVRIEVIRILAPIAILGFMSARFAHPDDWLSSDGFRIPQLDDDWRQPAHLVLPPWAALAVCIGIVVSGLATAAGAFTRISAAVFALLLGYVAVADRMSAFTVSKLGPTIALALCLTPAGARYSVDAWRAARRGQSSPELCTGGNVRYFQVLLPVFYFASGLCKARGAWLSMKTVLWTHVHDSYQTPVSWWLANHLPPTAWTILQATTLAFEVGAPLWFALRWTRPFAVGYGIAMHAMIGLMFGPVAWFSMLMIVLLVGAYAPITWLQPSFGLRGLPRARLRSGSRAARTADPRS